MPSKVNREAKSVHCWADPIKLFCPVFGHVFLLWSYLKTALCRCIYCAPRQNLYKQTNAEGKPQSRLEGKQTPNIAFHQPKQHARKSKMYSCKTKKRLFLFSMLMYSWNHIVLGYAQIPSNFSKELHGLWAVMFDWAHRLFTVPFVWAPLYEEKTK